MKDWENVHRDITSNFNKGKNGGVMGILALSYNDLPNQLKSCFLYLGLFPENYAIPRKKLIQLWVAEGFIPHTKEDVLVTMEHVAKHQYLAELIQRCMIQVDKDVTPGKGKTCRIHDLMRDLCLSKAKEMNFLDVYNHRIDNVTSDSLSSETCKRLRRYAIHLNDQTKRYDFYFNNSACSIRTLFIEIPLGNPLMQLKYQNIKLLRVLDFENVSQFNPDMTKEVSRLIYLRYLALTGHPETRISSSIGNLLYLQTLKLFFFRGILPETTTKLVQLRHLVLHSGEVTDNFQIENSINLQTVGTIKAGKWIRMGCLEKLSKLRKLSVVATSRMQNDILIHEIISKRSLPSAGDQYRNPIRVLSIQSDENFSDTIFDSLSYCHNLHRPKLDGKLNALNLFNYPPNLNKLELYRSKLEEDPMGTLQYLPNLTSLEMVGTYTGEEMVCSTDGFPRLQFLYISAFEQLTKLTIHQGGMPHLKELYIRRLRELSMLPEGLRFITTLRKLKIDRMPKIKDRVEKEVGEDWYKVQHIPSLIITNYFS